MADLDDATAGAAGAPLPLILDFLAWLAPAPRPYAEVMEGWRTSCPRLTVWEDALDDGLVTRAGPTVSVTPRGLARLRAAGRADTSFQGIGSSGP